MGLAVLQDYCGHTWARDAAQPGVSYLDELERLGDLRERDIISDEEFGAK